MVLSDPRPLTWILCTLGDVETPTRLGFKTVLVTKQNYIPSQLWEVSAYAENRTTKAYRR